MPAPIPPGYTRGQLMFIGNLAESGAASQLLQTFWTEAGAFGGRILIVNVEDDPRAHTAEQLFRAWESDSVHRLDIASRRAAVEEAHVHAVEDATAILLCAADGQQMMRRLGGTVLAQAIRRANARNKIVGGIGAAAGALCQHMMLAGDVISRDQSNLIQFAPGLGLINRTAITATLPNHAEASLSRQLVAAVTANPFLIGVGLHIGAAVIIYQDGTLDVRGQGRAIVLDGVVIEDDMPAHDTISAHIHTLDPGYGYNLDTHSVRPPTQTDIPAAESNVTSVF